LVVEVLPVLEVNCNSLLVPNPDKPAFAKTKEPGFVPTLTLAVPDVGVGKKDVEAKK
jgi:hypothetical protein